MDNQKYGMLFETSPNSHYYFDAGTGKVITCSTEERDFIEKVLDGTLSLEKAKEINTEFKDFLDEENLFADYDWTFSVPTREEYQELVEGHCRQIVLELTEACNLRCEYCIYSEHHRNFRGYSGKCMTFETAKKSIDLILNGYKDEEFALSFYGGEPLMNFPLLKKCIEYAKKAYPDVKMSFSFTTNLTLLTQEMLDFFISLENIEIMCSLDGPQDIHDKYRLDTNGKGTYDKAIQNFKLLLEKFYDLEKKRILMINCVMVPPYTKEKLHDIYHFFYETLKIPRTIICNYSYVDLGDMKIKETLEPLEQQKSKISPLEAVAAEDFLKKKEDSEFFRLIDLELYRVANRARTEKGVIDSGFLHGNCIPGKRRMYVTVDGNFKTCEKVGNLPFLGNCETGFDYDKSYKFYIEDYANYYRNKCSNCWARNMCSICYDNAIAVDSEIPYKTGKLCETSRKLVREMFIDYYHLFEKDKEGLAKAVGNMKIK